MYAQSRETIFYSFASPINLPKSLSRPNSPINIYLAEFIQEFIYSESYKLTD